MAIDPHKYDLRLSESRWDRLMFRIEHWLLSPGSSDVARLRGYLRVKDWRRHTSTRERLHAIKVTAKLPARALREAAHAVETYGGYPAEQFGISRARQLRTLWWLWIRHGVEPKVYYAFQLYRPEQLRRAPSFFQKNEDDQLFRLLNLRTAPDEAEMMLDKAQFERWLVERGLPTVRTMVEFAAGQVVRSSLGDGGLPRTSLFSKPNDALQGIGTQRWQYDGEGWVGADGRRRGEAELLAELAELSHERPLLVQEQLRNHSALAPLAPAALSTVRVLTLRGLDGVVRVVLAVCKIPTGAAPTDHMRLGGMAAPVDLATGRLGRAIGKSKKTLVAPYERHPDTGVTIDGFQLPLWGEVMRVAVRAHEALARLVCVGWDVAILESGPVIIEGNDNPGHTSSQLPTGVAMAETAVVPTLAAHLRAAFR